MDRHTDAGQTLRPLLWIGICLGIGIVGSLDEIVLHQILQWHNFYVHTTQFWRIVIDGIFHVVTSGLLMLGAVLIWRQAAAIRRPGAVRALVGGILLGLGGFNLYDGIIQHKLMQLHPVREGVANLLPYDLAFNGIALALLVAGWLVWRSAAAGAGHPASAGTGNWGGTAAAG